MQKVIHSSGRKVKISQLIHGETYTMSEVTAGLSFSGKKPAVS